MNAPENPRPGRPFSGAARRVTRMTRKPYPTVRAGKPPAYAATFSRRGASSKGPLT
jgi:hypothetical protein